MQSSASPRGRRISWTLTGLTTLWTLLPGLFILSRKEAHWYDYGPIGLWWYKVYHCRLLPKASTMQTVQGPKVCFNSIHSYSMFKISYTHSKRLGVFETTFDPTKTTQISRQNSTGPVARAWWRKVLRTWFRWSIREILLFPKGFTRARPIRGRSAVAEWHSQRCKWTNLSKNDNVC